MKRILALHLLLIMLVSLIACDSGDMQNQTDNNPSNQPQEQSSEKTVDENDENGENGRSKATEFIYELDAEEELTVANLIFDEDVTVSGDFGIIVFENCVFKGDIINTAEQFTRVVLANGTTVNGACVFRNTTKEGTMDTPVPKFIGSETLTIVCEECIGAGVVDNAGANIIFNGQSYSISDAEYFWDTETEGVVPYQGQEASALYVGQWWENGEKFMFIECEE